MTTRVPVLLLAVAGGAAAAPSPQEASGARTLFAVTAPQHEHVARLIAHEGQSVLFHHATLAVVESANGTAPALPGAVAITDLGRTQDLKYFVLLKGGRHGNASRGLSPHQWQHEIVRENPKVRVVFANETAMLMSSNPLDWPKSADTTRDAEDDDVFEGLTLPKHTHYLPLLDEPLSASAHASTMRADAIRAAPQRNVVIERLVEEVSAPALRRIVEAMADGWESRQAASPGAFEAAQWLKSEFEELGFETELQDFSEEYSPNVVATQLGTRHPDQWVVVGAHYDSRGRDRTDQEEIAPGANDDGSGIAAMVELARITQSMQASYEYSLMIVCFGAEELGLVGSNALAEKMLNEETEIIGMYAADMIGYRVPGRGLQVGLPIVSHTPAMTALAEVAFNLYVPDVETCEYTGCCTDNVPFLNRGFPSSRFFEACGALDDPKYHTPEDAFPREGFGEEGYDIGKMVMLSGFAVRAASLILESITIAEGTLKHITKGMLATFWTLLTPSIE